MSPNNYMMEQAVFCEKNANLGRDVGMGRNPEREKININESSKASS